MLSAPGATSLKLPSLPRATLLADATVFEDLAFASASPDAEQEVVLDFVPQRGGEMRGLAIHIEVDVLEAGTGAGDGGSQSDGDRSGAVAAEADRGGATAVAPPRLSPEISSARAGSHWPNVLLMLPEPVEVVAGVGRIRVRCTSSLGSEKPLYTFEVRMLADDESAKEVQDADRAGVLLGTLTYPE